MDMQFSVCVFGGRKEGRMDGWIDGCCVNNGGRECGGGRSAFPAMQAKYRQHLGKIGLRGLGCLVCWLLACLMGGWMDGL